MTKSLKWISHLVLCNECHCTTGRPGLLSILSQWCEQPSVVSLWPIFTAPRQRPWSASSVTDSTTHDVVIRSRDRKWKTNCSLNEGHEVLSWTFVLLLPTFSPPVSSHTFTNVPAQSLAAAAAASLIAWFIYLNKIN